MAARALSANSGGRRRPAPSPTRPPPSPAHPSPPPRARLLSSPPRPERQPLRRRRPSPPPRPRLSSSPPRPEIQPLPRGHPSPPPRQRLSSSPPRQRLSSSPPRLRRSVRIKGESKSERVASDEAATVALASADASAGASDGAPTVALGSADKRGDAAASPGRASRRRRPSLAEGAEAEEDKGEGAYAPAVAASGRRPMAPPAEPCGSAEERREWARTRAEKKLPAHIGPYAVVDVRGTGSYGRVFEVAGPRALETAGAPGGGGGGECVRRALKVMASRWTEEEGEDAETLAEVATANLRPGHPNLLPVLAQFRYRDAGDGRLRLALVLPLAAGDLQALARRWSALDRAVELEEAAAVAAGPRLAPGAAAAGAARRAALRLVVREARLEALLGVWRGMRALHTAGSLHMDIKPENALRVLGEGRTLPPLALDARGIARLPPAALEGEPLRLAMQLLAGSAAALGGSWRLSDPGLAIRVGGARATRSPWERSTSIYRAPSADCGDPAVGARDDWYAFGALAAAVAFDLRHGPFAPELDARALARIVREVGFEEDPDAPLDAEAEAVARVVERDRRVPGSAAFLAALAARASGEPGGRARDRARRCVHWLRRNAFARVDGLAAELARAAAAGDTTPLHAAMLRLTGWGPSVLARWRLRYWGAAQFDALALFVLMLLQSDPRERDASHAGAALSPAAAALDAVADLCPLEPDRRRALTEPLEVLDEPDHDGAFDAVRFARPETRLLAIQLFGALHGMPAFYTALPLSDSAFAPLLRDTLAALAAKLEQENVSALRLPVRAVVVGGVRYTRGALEDAVGAQLRLNYFGPALQPAADPPPPLFAAEAACPLLAPPPPPPLPLPAPHLSALAHASAKLAQAERLHALVRDMLDSPAGRGGVGVQDAGSSPPLTPITPLTPSYVRSSGGWRHSAEPRVSGEGKSLPPPPYVSSAPSTPGRSPGVRARAPTRLPGGAPLFAGSRWVVSASRSPTSGSNELARPLARAPRSDASLLAGDRSAWGGAAPSASPTPGRQSPTPGGAALVDGRIESWDGSTPSASTTPGRNELVRTRSLAHIPSGPVL